MLLQRHRYLVSIGRLSWRAFASHVPQNSENEIDLITLKKKPKANETVEPKKSPLTLEAISNKYARQISLFQHFAVKHDGLDPLEMVNQFRRTQQNQPESKQTRAETRQILELCLILQNNKQVLKGAIEKASLNVKYNRDPNAKLGSLLQKEWDEPNPVRNKSLNLDMLDQLAKRANLKERKPTEEEDALSKLSLREVRKSYMEEDKGKEAEKVKKLAQKESDAEKVEKKEPKVVKKESSNVKKEPSNVKKETPKTEKETLKTEKETRKTDKETPNLKKETSDVVKKAKTEKEPNAEQQKKDQESAAQTLAELLREAKQTKEKSQQLHFKQQKNYEWSKLQLSPDSHKLESGNFFTPKFIPQTLIPTKIIGKPSSTKNDFLFPKMGPLTKEYLLLLSNGKTIVTKENPLGKGFIPKDMFTIFQTLESPERFIKKVNKLQKKRWKLIDGGGSAAKVLVFERPITERYKSTFQTVKSLLALVGVTFIALLGISLLDQQVEEDDFDLEEIELLKPV